MMSSDDKVSGEDTNILKFEVKVSDEQEKFKVGISLSE